MEVSEAKRLKALEEENAKLKKLLAEQMLDAAALGELLSKKMLGPAAKRAAVAHLQAFMSLSERRACSIVGRRSEHDPLPLQPPSGRGSARSVAHRANERRRFGYRRLFVLLRREGEPSGVNRIYRLYREEGQQQPVSLVVPSGPGWIKSADGGRSGCGVKRSFIWDMISRLLVYEC
jgi:hypothetical protein